MSKALKDFKKLMLQEGLVTKPWQAHAPGTRIAPTKSGDNNKSWQPDLKMSSSKTFPRTLCLYYGSFTHLLLKRNGRNSISPKDKALTQ